MSKEDTSEVPATEMHRFWSQQPVVSAEAADDLFEGYIDPTITVTAPPDTPCALPSGFSWSNIDIKDPNQLKELHNFLYLHYVEDSDHRFRFHLSEPLIEWTLTSPGQFPDWIFGVRTANGSICGFIAGIPSTIRLNDKVEPWCTVDFLCVHGKLRNKKLAQILIFELARRVRLQKIYRAVFSGHGLPSKPFQKTMNFHRPINVPKLNASGFLQVDASGKHRALKHYAMPPLVHGNARPFTEADVDGVTELLQTFTGRFKFAIQFTPDLVRHMFMPRDSVVYSYVITAGDKIQAFFSFYMMNWTVLRENTLTEIHSAYLYYLATTSADSSSVVADAINKAKADANADIVNSVSQQGLGPALTTHRFERGSGALEYYSYNYAVPSIDETESYFLFV